VVEDFETNGSDSILRYRGLTVENSCNSVSL